MNADNKNSARKLNETDIIRINDLSFDKERELYGIRNAIISRCVFDGPADGESALKESGNITVSDCDFRLRYPFWHVENALVENCRMTEDCRAAFWYDKDICIKSSVLSGIKAVRECRSITIENCNINSSEFGWLSSGMVITKTEISSEYPFFNSSDSRMNKLTLNGKYSFQYVNNIEITNSVLNTKDAFWHAKNVTVSDSVIKGEYLGWYSENLKLIRCKIIGTQPLCYASGLVLEDCEMTGCDLAFEKSDLHAVISGSVDSIKNPRSGYIKADSFGEFIIDDYSSCLIRTSEKAGYPGVCCCLS